MEEDKIKIEENADTTVEKNNSEINIQKEEKPIKKEKKKKFRIISDLIIFVLFLIILLEAVIGIINMQKLNNEEEPIWYLNSKTTKTELKTETTYNLGLYKIVKTDTAKKTTIQLKPFFIGE